MADSKAIQDQLEQYREMSPNQIALAMASLSRALNTLAEEQEPLERAAVEAKEHYTKEYAKLFLEAEGNNEERKQQVLWKTSELRLASELADTQVKMHIVRINTLRKRIDIARSAAALVRAEWELMNTRTGR
jgi:hypothetical protein